MGYKLNKFLPRPPHIRISKCTIYHWNRVHPIHPQFLCSGSFDSTTAAAEPCKRTATGKRKPAAIPSAWFEGTAEASSTPYRAGAKKRSHVQGRVEEPCYISTDPDPNPSLEKKRSGCDIIFLQLALCFLTIYVSKLNY